MNSETPKLSEEEVFLAFSVEPTHDRMTLERYLRDYPEHAEMLVECSIELMVDATRNVAAEVTSEAAVDKAWQRFKTTVKLSSDLSVVNPFAKLSQTDFKSLAKRLDVTNLLLVRLRDRAIEVATIPQRFVQRLTTELGSNAEAVTAYLSSPPGMVSSHKFRSAVKPTVIAQISFEQAIEISHLTQSQQDALKALKD